MITKMRIHIKKTLRSAYSNACAIFSFRHQIIYVTHPWLN